jgi:hypothetical protein
MPATSILQSTETTTDLTAVGKVPELAESGPAASGEHSAEYKTTTDLTAVGEVPELAESRPAAGDEHFAVWTELAPAHRTSIHNLTGLRTNKN